MKNRSNLLRMAVFAAQSLKSYRTGMPPDLPKGYRFTALLEAPGFPRMGYVAESPSATVIAFRGTKKAEDVKKDLLARQIPYPYRRGSGWSTHAGFTELYRLLRPGLRLALRRTRSGKALYITGYSLGGALACLCALDPAVRKTPASVRLFTFGAPRVGNPAFAEALQIKTSVAIRVHNAGDWVPTLPPESFLGAQYRHGGHGLPLDNRKSNPVSSHSMQAYREGLEALAGASHRRAR